IGIVIVITKMTHTNLPLSMS
uniref:Uncharacterized protein n=1 Tax=Amphimedon queenslandica TaxID=400682 RepID=A0A1X7VTM9_AMPQE